MRRFFLQRHEMRETDCMAVEDVHVRYESRRRRSELCMLCLRCFADEDDNLEDVDDQWRSIKCIPFTRDHRRGSEHSEYCELCNDCWLKQARDNRCPICRVDITAWRMNAFACELHMRKCLNFMRLSKRRRVLEHQTD